MANWMTQNKRDDILLEHIRTLGVEMAVIFLLYVDAGPEYFVRIDSLASKYRIATEFMLRFIFVSSDGIVIWRTWSLFSYRKSVKVLLSLCLLASSICIFVDAGLYTEKVLQDGFNAVDDPRQNMMVIIPLLITNLVATVLVCYMTWRHRKDIRQSLGNTVKMTSKIQRILAYTGNSRKLLAWEQWLRYWQIEQ
ncbi:hypothetical protein K435DRAFT_844862 [Dendrothele bispora CBS 962.96]|uniref:Uncharacterized protein n=1 Tax=Dendrothele bispora (strain CBS 962.96) TaxID=1314807 RepID=A0A4S8KYF6_DENBC|nr:hypothetical protein K435DRAFT_844862 [Dendrothele bispora CBS 962.96]